MVWQELEEEIRTACAELDLPLPVPVSAEADDTMGALRRLVTVAVRPEGNIPFTAARRVSLCSIVCPIACVTVTCMHLMLYTPLLSITQAHKLLMRKVYMGGLMAAGAVSGALLIYCLYSYATRRSPSKTTSSQQPDCPSQNASGGSAAPDTGNTSWFGASSEQGAGSSGSWFSTVALPAVSGAASQGLGMLGAAAGEVAGAATAAVQRAGEGKRQ